VVDSAVESYLPVRASSTPISPSTNPKMNPPPVVRLRTKNTSARNAPVFSRPGRVISSELTMTAGRLILPETDDHILKSNLQVLRALNEEIRNADIQIAKDAVSEEQVKLLMTMPGVDYYAAMIMLSEIGDVKRFASPEKLVSWAGLAPQVHQSGETQWTGRITKKGSKRVRWILAQCAHTARQHDPKMKGFYERMERKHGSRKAITAVARKMLSIMHVMLTRNEPYHGENRQLTMQKHKRLERIANTA